MKSKLEHVLKYWCKGNPGTKSLKKDTYPGVFFLIQPFGEIPYFC